MKEKSPLVSVLVTPYNQKDYIRQSLDSILMQQCDFDFEVVIGEDCSTDGTREICQEYAAKHPERIVLCLNEVNKGLLNNYFDIFLKAKGNYIADCGGDDYWLTDSKLQEQVDLLEANPEVSLVAGNWQLYEQKTGLLTRPRSWLVQDRFQPEEFGKHAVASYLNVGEIPRVVLASSCFRGDWARDSYQHHPELFRGEGIVCEDLPLTLGLLMRGPFYFSQKNWLTYRVLEKSLSHSDSWNSYMKGFAFSAYCQTLDLATTLGVSIRQIRPYALGKAGDFVLHACLNKDPEFLEKVFQTLNKHALKPSFKQRFLRWSMHVPPLAALIRSRHFKEIA
jgi:glycosyltransferase involved in cell wall biosynthesis